MNMTSGFSGMAPEDIFALGIQKGLALVKDMGRNGDSELAHVNPQEAQMLEQTGGSGTVNPQTGLPEFFGGGGRAGGVGRDNVGGGFSGRDNDAGSAGGGDRDGGGGRAGGVGTSGVGGGFDGPGGGRAGGVGSAGVGGGFDGGASSNPSSGGGDGGAGPTGDAGAADTRSFGERVVDGLAAAFGGPSLGPPTSRDPGFLGAAAGLAPGVGWGMGLTRGLQAMGIPGREVEEGELGTDSYSGTRDGDILTPPRQQQAQQQPNQTPQFSWQRPGAAPTAPGGLNLDAGMTPLQQRTAVATGGTSGNAGIYRDPAVVEFYRNLALYDLTQPGGAPRSDATVTPIEQQYLTQLGGQPGSSIADFLKALGGLKPA